jgi:SNW domain-containing protein 1
LAQDFSDGGAYPEITAAQFPLAMGRFEKASSSNALAVQLNAEGKVKYDVIARSEHPGIVLFTAD